MKTTCRFVRSGSEFRESVHSTIDKHHVYYNMICQVAWHQVPGIHVLVQLPQGALMPSFVGIKGGRKGERHTVPSTQANTLAASTLTATRGYTIYNPKAIHLRTRMRRDESDANNLTAVPRTLYPTTLLAAVVDSIQVAPRQKHTTRNCWGVVGHLRIYDP